MVVYFLPFSSLPCQFVMLCYAMQGGYDTVVVAYRIIGYYISVCLVCLYVWSVCMSGLSVCLVCLYVWSVCMSGLSVRCGKKKKKSKVDRTGHASPVSIIS